MAERLTSTELQNFLKDFKDNSHTEIYEKGREKEEIIQIAKAKMGIDLKNNTDLAGFKTIYTFANVPNDNGARLPKRLLLKALPTIIGKPVNVNHIRNYVVGYYIDYRYIEAKDQVVAYGLFFKSNFGQEWTEAKQLLKSNLLGTSHEVWCPKNSRRYLSDGTYEATAMEFAGGALIYRTHRDTVNPSHKMKTAYKGCDVLEMAMQYMDKNPSDLIFASLDHSKKKQYNNEDLIIASEAEEFARRTEEEIKQKVETGFHRSHEQENSNNENSSVLPQIPKIICGNCKYEFETNEVGEILCKECKAIIDRTGKVLYPPQIMEFKFVDPEEGTSNFRLIEVNDERAIVKNLNSNKIWQLKFKKANDNDELIGRMNFVYIGTASCPQCGYSQSISTVSNVDKVELKCPSCELKYHKNIKRQLLGKQIEEYKDITEEFKNKALKKENEDKGEKEMKELYVASLQEESNIELEIASQDFPENVLTLEIASIENEEDLYQSIDDSLILAKVLTTETRKAIPDELFAVVKIVKNKKTGESRKIRKFPINDEVHVRNALARLGQEPTRRALKKLEISVESVKRKILSRAKKLGMKDLLERYLEKSSIDQIDKYKAFIRKIVNKIRELKKEKNLDTANLKSANVLEIAKIQEEADKKIEFYKVNAVELVRRRNELDKFGEELSDEKIMDDDSYALAKSEKDNALLKASLNKGIEFIGDKSQMTREDSEIKKLHSEINEKAFKNS